MKKNCSVYFYIKEVSFYTKSICEKEPKSTVNLINLGKTRSNKPSLKKPKKKMLGFIDLG